MTGIEHIVITEYKTWLGNMQYPCIAARAALHAEQVDFFTASHLGCPADDDALLKFLYDFVDRYRRSKNSYLSAVSIFTGPETANEEMFDELMWQRLQSLADLDAKNYAYDSRVDKDTASSKFSFSIKGEAFYIIGMHPSSSRQARRFRYPALVFNPHDQFEKLRETHQYEKMKGVVRRRDTLFSGSVNPMLDDFGESSEVLQYSGRKYDENWKCPLKITHAPTTDHTAT